MTARRVVRWAGVALLVAVLGIQLVPVDRSNPPVDGLVPAPAPALAVLKRACWDCHSNETRWPWYAYVAPVSWLVANDVHEGRGEMNFTEWNRASARRRSRTPEKVWEEVSEGEMPLPQYVRAHPEARLGEADLEALRAWAGATRSGGGHGRR
jgi:hypothetical protein